MTVDLKESSVRHASRALVAAAAAQADVFAQRFPATSRQAAQRAFQRRLEGDFEDCVIAVEKLIGRGPGPLGLG